MTNDVRKLVSRERELREKESLTDGEREELRGLPKKISAALEDEDADPDYRREGRSGRRSSVDSLSLPELVQLQGQLKASGNEQAANNLQAAIVARTESLCEREGVEPAPVARSKSDKSKQDEQPGNSGSGKKSGFPRWLENLAPRA